MRLQLLTHAELAELCRFQGLQDTGSKADCASRLQQAHLVLNELSQEQLAAVCDAECISSKGTAAQLVQRLSSNKAGVPAKFTGDILHVGYCHIKLNCVKGSVRGKTTKFSTFNAGITQVSCLIWGCTAALLDSPAQDSNSQVLSVGCCLGLDCKVAAHC